MFFARVRRHLAAARWEARLVLELLAISDVHEDGTCGSRHGFAPTRPRDGASPAEVATAMRRPSASARSRESQPRHSRRSLLARRGPAKARIVAADGYSATPANDIRPIPGFRASATSSQPIRLNLTFVRIDDDVALAELSRILKRMAGRRGEG